MIPTVLLIYSAKQPLIQKKRNIANAETALVWFVHRCFTPCSLIKLYLFLFGLIWRQKRCYWAANQHLGSWHIFSSSSPQKDEKNTKKQFQPAIEVPSTSLLVIRLQRPKQKPIILNGDLMISDLNTRLVGIHILQGTDSQFQKVVQSKLETRGDEFSPKVDRVKPTWRAKTELMRTKSQNLKLFLNELLGTCKARIC